MYETLIAALLWLSVLGCALMAGVYFAFSAFIMRALGEVDRGAGIAVMNAINRVIVRSQFMPVFLGSTLIAVVLAVAALLDPMAAHALPTLIGSGLYVMGMFVVTAARNVPLNDALAAIDGPGEAARAMWARYQTQWTRWNHVRTLCSLGACALHIRAISLL